MSVAVCALRAGRGALPGPRQRTGGTGGHRASQTAGVNPGGHEADDAEGDQRCREAANVGAYTLNLKQHPASDTASARGNSRHPARATESGHRGFVNLASNGDEDKVASDDAGEVDDGVRRSFVLDVFAELGNFLAGLRPPVGLAALDVEVASHDLNIGQCPAARIGTGPRDSQTSGSTSTRIGSVDVAGLVPSTRVTSYRAPS
jgi:hypothetical protein